LVFSGLKSDNARKEQQIYRLKEDLKRLEKYEKDARLMWRELVTPERASSNFIWRDMSKRYI
jgi:hypothetical protein